MWYYFSTGKGIIEAKAQLFALIGCPVRINKAFFFNYKLYSVRPDNVKRMLRGVDSMRDDMQGPLSGCVETFFRIW